MQSQLFRRQDGACGELCWIRGGQASGTLQMPHLFRDVESGLPCALQ